MKINEIESIVATVNKSNVQTQGNNTTIALSTLLIDIFLFNISHRNKLSYRATWPARYTSSREVVFVQVLQSLVLSATGHLYLDWPEIVSTVACIYFTRALLYFPQLTFGLFLSTVISVIKSVPEVKTEVGKHKYRKMKIRIMNGDWRLAKEFNKSCSQQLLLLINDNNEKSSIETVHQILNRKLIHFANNFHTVLKIQINLFPSPFHFFN